MWSELIAGWASALGSLFAASVALSLGWRTDAKSDQHSDRRSAAAATVVSPRLFKVRSLIDTFVSAEADLHGTPDGYSEWAVGLASSVQSYGRVVEDRYASLLADLPTADLHLLVLADHAFEEFKLRISNLHKFVLASPTTFLLAEAMKIRNVVEISSESMHKLMKTGGGPPWEQYSKDILRPSTH